MLPWPPFTWLAPKLGMAKFEILRIVLAQSGLKATVNGKKLITMNHRYWAVEFTSASDGSSQGEDSIIAFRFRDLTVCSWPKAAIEIEAFCQVECPLLRKSDIRKHDPG
jgi:hypothetical protein